MVSYEKMSKKQKKAENTKKRNLWPISPVTKVVPAKKGGKYDRNKLKRTDVKDSIY